MEKKEYLHRGTVVERLRDGDDYQGGSTVQGGQQLLEKCQLSLTSVTERTKVNRLFLSFEYPGGSVLAPSLLPSHRIPQAG